MQIIFIRHTSVDVEPGTCYGQTDVPLRETFPQEATTVKNKIAGMNFDEVYCSPLSRCLRLANFCGFGNPVMDPRLMEMDFGEWEMKKYDEIDDPRLQLWYDDFLRFTPTGGESSMAQRDRLNSFLQDLRQRYAASPEKTIAIFTHGGIIIHALTILQGLTYPEAFARQPQYGDVVPMELII